jgi:ABC-type nitrate/sulfonate/bicarbonate transport system ATPase subunit
MSRVGDRVRLEARVAKKSFRTASGQSSPVIAGLSFALNEGETGALIGPSGCGKSTLMRILAGLDRDFEGSVNMPLHGRVGMVFQEPRLLPWRGVEHNVRLAAPDASEAEIAALFDALGLSEHRAHFPGELSVGLARRAALARAFAVRPTLLLLDEPFVSLDAPLARQLQGDLARLVESRRMITVLVTHDVDEAVALADRIFVLSARPTHVVGEIQVASPRAAVSGEERQAVAARIEALREPNPPVPNRPVR